MSYIGAKKRLGNIPSLTLGAIPTILRAKKKQKNAREVPNINTGDDLTFVYWIDGMGIGGGCTVVIRIDPDSD